MTMTGGVDGASLKIGAKSFTEEALLAAITKIELGNLQFDSYRAALPQVRATGGREPVTRSSGDREKPRPP
jgi:glycine betaine/choline ABC-type transport system substrate-binding protein